MEEMPYELPTSIWDLIKETVPEVEQDEMRQILGLSLVDDVESLRTEAELLLEIWADVRADHVTVAKATLPEAPGQRDALVREIDFFVSAIREKAAEAGRADLVALCESAVVEYVTRTQSPARPRSGLSQGRLTPMAPSRLQSSLSSPADIAELRPDLTLRRIGNILVSLRVQLEEEIFLMKEHISFLQGAVEEAAADDFPEPSLSDLKSERSKLEREMTKGLDQVTLTFSGSESRGQKRQDRLNPKLLELTQQRLKPLGTVRVGSVPAGSVPAPQPPSGPRPVNTRVRQGVMARQR